MKARTAWVVVVGATCLGASLASLMRSKRQGAKRTHKAQLRQWENEGGSVLPSPETNGAVAPAAGPT